MPGGGKGEQGPPQGKGFGVSREKTEGHRWLQWQRGQRHTSRQGEAGTEQPFNAGLGTERHRPAWKIREGHLRPCPAGTLRAPPALGSRTNTTDRERNRRAAGASPACLVSSPGHGSAWTVPAVTVSPAPPPCCSSPRSAAVSLGRSKEILRQLSQEPVQVICTGAGRMKHMRNRLHVPGTWWDETPHLSITGEKRHCPAPGPIFCRTSSFSSPPSAGPTHPCHSRQLPPALLAQAWGSVGTGRSPQETALCCGCPSSPVPSPQG